MAYTSSDDYVLHYDKSKWTSQLKAPSNAYYPGMPSFNAIWGASKTDIWLGGFDYYSHDGFIYRYDGKAGKLWKSMWGFVIPERIWGFSSSEVFVISSDYNGSDYSVRRYVNNARTYLSLPSVNFPVPYDIWCTKNTHLFIVGSEVDYYNGTKCTIQDPETSMVLRPVGSPATPISSL